MDFKIYVLSLSGWKAYPGKVPSPSNDWFYDLQEELGSRQNLPH